MSLFDLTMPEDRERGIAPPPVPPAPPPPRPLPVAIEEMAPTDLDAVIIDTSRESAKGKSRGRERGEARRAAAREWLGD